MDTRRNNKIIVVLGLLLLIIVVLALLGDKIRDARLMKKSEEVINSIERYRQIQGKLPTSLDEIGYKNDLPPNDLYYEIINDDLYYITFMHSIDYNYFYYSDERKWRKGIR